MELSVIVPCLNEELNLKELISKIQKTFLKNSIDGEIILVDDGSSDETGNIIMSFEKDFANIRGLRHRQNLGITACWKTGLKVAKGEYTAIIDADLQYRPEEIGLLYMKAKANKNDIIVQGWRSYCAEKFTFRFFLSKGLNLILNLFFNLNLRDAKSCFFICRKTILEHILSYSNDFSYFQCFIFAFAQYLNYKIIEIPIHFDKRKRGKAMISKFPIMISIKILFEFIKVFNKIKRNVYEKETTRIYN